MHLLLVEDDTMLANTICDGVRQRSWSIDHLGSANAAKTALVDHRCTTALLDLLATCVEKQYPDAMNIKASLGAYDAAKAEIGKGAEQTVPRRNEHQGQPRCLRRGESRDWQGCRAVGRGHAAAGIRDSGFGIRDSGFGIWDLGFGIWVLGAGKRRLSESFSQREKVPRRGG